MNNKEEILNKLDDYTEYPETCKEIAEEYAKEIAIDFLEWTTGRNLEISLGVFVDNFGTYDSMNEYYELYLKSKQ